MKQAEQLELTMKKVRILDEQLKLLRVAIHRLENRIIVLEESVVDRTVVFESDWDPDSDDDN